MQLQTDIDLMYFQPKLQRLNLSKVGLDEEELLDLSDYQ
jgi:hypothetical protein